MAVDTRNKRASVLGLTLAALVALPAPNGTVGTSDRAHVAACYAGLSATPPPVDETQDALRGMTLSGGTQRRTDVIGGSAARGATITPGSVRRVN